MTAERGRAKFKVERFGCGWTPPLLIAKECRVIQLLPCPVCHQPTLFPDGVSLQATLECPHCREQFVVGEMLNARYSTWLVVHDPAYLDGPQSTAAALAMDGSEADSAAEDTTADYELSSAATAAGDDQDDSAPLQLQAASAAPPKPKTDWSKFEPITHEQFERMKRKSRSPIWSLLQIVLGGVAAVPISLLLIWHVIGTDVAGAGPRVGRYAPWLVPEKFRPFDFRAEQSQAEPPPRTTVPPAPGASGFRNFDDVLVAPADPASPVVASLEGTEADRSPSGTSSQAAALGDDLASSSVFDRIQHTKRDLELWEQAVGDESANLKELALPLYRGFVDVALAIAAQPADNPVMRVVSDEMASIARAVKERPQVQQVIRQGASYWIKQQSNRLPFSLAMIVEVESVAETEQGWRLKPLVAQRLTVGGVPLEIEVPSRLGRGLTAGNSYLLLGSVTAAKGGAGPAPLGGTSLTPDQSTASASQTASSLSELDGAPDRAYFLANYLYAL